MLWGFSLIRRKTTSAIRHVYANPFMPEVCPITALGIYLLCNRNGTSSPSLFNGSSDQDRYTKCISKIMKGSAHAPGLAAQGQGPTNVGTQSPRKGCKDFVTTRTEIFPPAFADTHIRGGFPMPSFLGHYTVDGDQYVGRLCSGMPPDMMEFSTLPPFFTVRTELLAEAIRDCFPAVPPSFTPVAEFCLASVIFHREFFRQSFPATHALFGTTLFRDPRFIAGLAPLVQCHLPTSADPIQPTGVPAIMSKSRDLLIKTMRMQEELEEKVAKFQAEQRARLVQMMVETVTAEFAKRGIIIQDDPSSEPPGTTSTDAPQQASEQPTTMAAAAASGETAAGEPKLVAPMSVTSCALAAASAAGAATPSGVTGDSTTRTYSWGGTMHCVPEHFTLPKVTPLVAWQQYCCGDASLGYPALRLLTSHDMPTATQKKRLSDYRFLMGEVEFKVREADRWVPNPTVLQANEMFAIAEPHILGPVQTRKRRASQLSWTTIVNQIRSKRQRTTDGVKEDEKDAVMKEEEEEEEEEEDPGDDE